MSQPPDEQPPMSRREYRESQARKHRGYRRALRGAPTHRQRNHDPHPSPVAPQGELRPEPQEPPAVAPEPRSDGGESAWHDNKVPAARLDETVRIETQGSREHVYADDPWTHHADADPGFGDKAYIDPTYPDNTSHDDEYDGTRHHETAQSQQAHLMDAGPAAAVLAPDGEDWAHAGEPPRRRSPILRWGALLGAVAVVAVGGLLAWQVVSGFLPNLGFGGGGDDVADYPGPGSGEVSIDVPEGAGGGQIAEILASNDVVASVSAFTAAAAVDPRSVSIQPGRYLMAEEMSAEGALERMLDPEFRDVNGVTVREGLWKEEIFTVLASETGFEVADYEAVDVADLDLPDAADGEMEGYLFPDTYGFNSDDTPTEQLAAMVALGKTKYANLGLEGEALDTAIIKGSLIQAEGAFSDDLPKIARVIENRLDANQPLGFDSTIHFIFGERGRAGTTDSQRASDSPYNTYLLPGLPPGPINSPGIETIEAALEPAEGPWLYFVTTNPSTGETKFAETFEGHNENVAEFQQWCRDNPDDC